jgi:hypothetical protein
VGEGVFRTAVASLVGARLVGVLLAQILMSPCALLIVFVHGIFEEPASRSLF